MTAVKVTKLTEKEFPGLGAKIKAARKQMDRPLSLIAADAGMSAGNWYRIENGDAKSVPLETVRAIEAALGIDLGVDL